MPTPLNGVYSPEHCAAFVRWQRTGYSSSTISESDIALIEAEDPDSGAHIRRERRKAQEKAQAEAARQRAAATPAQLPAKRPRSERLAPKALPPLADSDVWKSVDTPGFGDALDRAVKTWLTHPERLTSYDISALKAVDPKYAAQAVKDRTDPSASDYDLSDGEERDLFLMDTFARMVHANFAIVRHRDMEHDRRLDALETRLRQPGVATIGGIDAVEISVGRDGALSSAAYPPSLISKSASATVAAMVNNLQVDYDGERTLTFAFKDGTPIEGGAIRLPIPLDRGIFKAGTQYEKGDCVTWGGSTWIAQRTTTAKPGEAGIESRAWRLSTKKGADGRDGKDAPR